jgi:hypothetical protein
VIGLSTLIVTHVWHLPVPQSPLVSSVCFCHGHLPLSFLCLTCFSAARRSGFANEEEALTNMIGYNGLSCNIHPNTYKMGFVTSVCVLSFCLCLILQTEDLNIRIAPKLSDAHVGDCCCCWWWWWWVFLLSLLLLLSLVIVLLCCCCCCCFRVVIVIVVSLFCERAAWSVEEGGRSVCRLACAECVRGSQQ